MIQLYCAVCHNRRPKAGTRLLANFNSAHRDRCEDDSKCLRGHDAAIKIGAKKRPRAALPPSNSRNQSIARCARAHLARALSWDVTRSKKPWYGWEKGC